MEKRFCNAQVGIFFGFRDSCGDTAIGLYRIICMHEHGAESALCAHHATRPDKGRCGACGEPIGIMLLESYEGDDSLIIG